MKTCAFLTCKDLSGFVHDDELLTEPLKKVGWQIRSIPWDSAADWSSFDAVVIRTTWDYTERLQEFLSTLQQIEQSAAPLYNPAHIARWNCNKKYLLDLEKKGVAIIPTVVRHDLKSVNLSDYFKKWTCEELIVKPVVGANARGAYRFASRNLASMQSEMQQVYQNQDFMIQPFLPKVVSEGEFSLHYFNGQLSHAILKTPRTGDFRVQEEHGGTILSVQPKESLKSAADKAIAAIGETLLYARVDMVQGGPEEWLLMELELIEPALYLRTNARAPQNFVDAFVQFHQAQD